MDVIPLYTCVQKSKYFGAISDCCNLLNIQTVKWIGWCKVRTPCASPHIWVWIVLSSCRYKTEVADFWMNWCKQLLSQVLSEWWALCGIFMWCATCVEIVILNAMCLWPCWWSMNKLRRLGAFAVSPLWSLDISWCALYDCVKYFHYTRQVTSKHGVRSESDCQLFVSTVFFSNHAVIQASTAV